MVQLAVTGGHGDRAMACCALPWMAPALRGNRLRVLASVKITALAKAGWTAAGDVGTEDAEAKGGALSSIQQEASNMVARKQTTFLGAASCAQGGEGNGKRDSSGVKGGGC